MARQRLSSVAMAIRLLKAFSEDREEIGVSALAQQLGLAKSTVHRLAVTLVAEGMLEKNPQTDKYRLGIALPRMRAHPFSKIGRSGNINCRRRQRGRILASLLLTDKVSSSGYRLQDSIACLVVTHPEESLSKLFVYERA